MLEQLALTVASLWNQTVIDQPGMKVWEKEIHISSTPIKINTDKDFTSMAIIGDDKIELPPIFFRAKKDENWRELHRDDQSINSTELLSGNARNSIWLKSKSPVLGKLIFLDTRIQGENLVAAFDPFDDDSYDDPETGLPPEVKVQTPKYISRIDWGANEDLRTWKRFRGLAQFFRKIVPEAKRLPKSQRPKIVSYKNETGKRLTWPVEQSQKIEKFVIHHTGEVIDETRQPKELMRAIYAYHTLTRGWGDIGYNYVIDQKGNIYEGRAGGAKIVGAHTAYHNVGSVGISLMGNFEVDDPTQAQLDVLTLLIADHAVRFKVDPLRKSSFLGKTSYNISGHKDVAEAGHGTSCPGVKLWKKLKWIRKETSHKVAAIKKYRKSGRDFLAKSKDAKKHQPNKKFKRPKKEPLISMKKIKKSKIIKRGEKTTVEVTVKNGTKFDWEKGAELAIEDSPDGLSINPLRSVQTIRSGRSGIFRATLRVKSTPNGKYNITFKPKIFHSQQDAMFKNVALEYPVQISGDKMSLFKAALKPYGMKSTIIKRNNKSSAKLQAKRASTFTARSTKTTPTDKNDTEKNEPEIKVKLGEFSNKIAQLVSDSPIAIWNNGTNVHTISPNTKINVIANKSDFGIRVSWDEKIWQGKDPELKTTGIITITNYQRWKGNGSKKYNQFRNQINFHTEKINGKIKLFLVNQLPLEKYLYGLGEEPNSEPTQKKHAIHILARSYGYVYSGKKRKFHTTLYDLEDLPQTSQLYLGYEWEKYHPEQRALVDETKGIMLKYNNVPVIGPYFTQSSGQSSNKWHTQYPWTRAQELPFDEGLGQRGHGVGLSGNSARAMAKRGDDYESILKFFFEGVEIGRGY